MLEGLPAIVLFGPLLFPIAKAMGVHEVHYAMVVILAMGIGLFAPPFGVGFFGACAIGRTNPNDSIWRIWPYIGALVVSLLIIAAVPVAVDRVPLESTSPCLLKTTSDVTFLRHGVLARRPRAQKLQLGQDKKAKDVVEAMNKVNGFTETSIGGPYAPAASPACYAVAGFHYRFSTRAGGHAHQDGRVLGSRHITAER